MDFAFNSELSGSVVNGSEEHPEVDETVAGSASDTIKTLLHVGGQTFGGSDHNDILERSGNEDCLTNKVEELFVDGGIRVATRIVEGVGSSRAGIDDVSTVQTHFF